MRHPVCALAEGAFKRKWYRLGWWLEHRVREKYGHQDYHFPIPRPEVYECPKCKRRTYE